ncbi:hypothetical protein MERGE_000981 [Pneumocystis wakefieldiae]|uniref:Calponin-homology (CH) domain-containing protein n=1 Tax=Pneumocystis wakefieldiae TaxID=38082 RepID=A0A899G593_9ASCO|nr:hypothetical protein MERGE_000981 [Pneumocystis wakefieldiae]
MSLLDRSWQDVQHKTFTKWVNTKLSACELPPAVSLKTDLSDGIRLISLLETIGDETLGKYNKNPRLRIQKAENVNKALDYIKSKGIPLTNIGAEDIIDGNLKLILGLLWTLILRFTIADINEEGYTAKEGLLLWCQRQTAEYENVNICDFTTSWTDGLSFCALIHKHRPDLLNFHELDAKDHRKNISLAFDIASKYIGIPQLLDVEDICDVCKPDERSIMTYIAQYFHAFSTLDKVETAGRRVEKFARTMLFASNMQKEYEEKMKDLINSIINIQTLWDMSSFDDSYADAKHQSSEFNEYKKTLKRDWVKQKHDLESLIHDIQTKLRTYCLKSYIPPKGLELNDLNVIWKELIRAEVQRSKQINDKIKDIKERLRQSFAGKANDFSLMLNTLSIEISGLKGDLEEQLEKINLLKEHISPLRNELLQLKLLEEECKEAKIEENDYTNFSYDDLEYELDLASDLINKKLQFIENQISTRQKTNLTSAQMKEFDSVFKHFDRYGINALQGDVFTAALAALGLAYDEQEMEDIIAKASNETGVVTYSQFIDFLVDEMEDHDSPDQVLLAFRDVADGKPYVTELDLRQSLIPSAEVEYLVSQMPELQENETEIDDEDRGFPIFDYCSYMEKLLDLNDTTINNKNNR